MFTIKANPTFEATVTLTGQGREQKLQVTFNHRSVSAFQALLDAVRAGDKTTADVLLELIVKWDADMELSADAIATLREEQPGADWAILSGYGEALAVARKGN